MERPISILLVEDNQDYVEVLRRFFRRVAGSYRVDIAYTGAEASAKARVHPYDLMLVDQHLPDVSGERLIADMRESVPELPIVMLTGHGDERLAVEVMKAGAYDYLRKDDLDPQVLYRTLRNVVERARLEAEVRRANERLREWAIRDGLTGLYNHRHFQDLLHTEFARALRYQQPLACLMIDLDHFKNINDTFGHPFGDEVLKQVARTLTIEARKIDIIARYGGEEFVVILPNTDAAGARSVAERVCAQVAQTPVEFDGKRVSLTLSVGVATTAEPHVTHESELVKLADAALYQAKRQGRNRVCVAQDRAPGGHLIGELTPTPTAPPMPREYESEVRRLYLQTVSELISMSEANSGRDDHSPRVALLATRMGQAMELPPSDIEALRAGAILHDIGHIAISDVLWSKPSALTTAERQQIQQHAVIGAQVLARSPLLERERQIVRHHHERWDGMGYPDGLAGEAIPLLARIVCICNAYESLTSSRPWRPAHDSAEAMRILEAAAGTGFDPELVKVFFGVVRKMEREGRT